MNLQKSECGNIGLMKNRKQYPTDVTDEEWRFAAPYLALMDGTRRWLRAGFFEAMLN